MTVDPERLNRLRANASLAVEQLGAISGMEFGLDEASVAWVEGFIERQRAQHASGESTGGLVNVLGSYLGEAIIAAADGRWDEDIDGNLGVAFPNGDMAYPFTKVAKQFEQGLEGGESILSFYKVSVNYIATGQLGKAATDEPSEAP